MPEIQRPGNLYRKIIMNPEKIKKESIESKPVENTEGESRLSQAKREALKKIRMALRAALIVGIGAAGSYGTMKYFKEPTPQQHYDRVVSGQAEIIAETKKKREAELAEVEKKLRQDESNLDLYTKRLRLINEISGLEFDSALDNFDFAFSGEIKKEVRDMKELGIKDVAAAELLADFPLGLPKTLMKESAETVVAKGHSVTGFEVIGIPSADMDRALSEEFYPRGTIKGRVGNVSYSDESKKSAEQYGVFLEDGKQVGQASGKDIVFFKDGPQKEKDKAGKVKAIVRIFSHELAHLNDFRHLPDLTDKQRLEFLIDINDCMKHSDIPENDYYVKNISNADRRTNNYLKATEYWAQLVSTYLENPKEFATVATKAEKKLVQKWFLRHDAEFDNQRRLAAIDKFIEQIK